MTCAEFKDNVAALALGALDPAERAACEAHLASDLPHEGCGEALARAIEATSLLGAALPPELPSPELWRRIASEIGAAAEAEGAGGSRAGEARAAGTRRDGRSAGERSGGVSRGDASRRGGAWREATAWGMAAVAAAAALVLFVERRSAERRLGETERELALAGDAEGDKRACLAELASARIELRQKAAAISLLSAPETRLVQLAAQGGVPYRASALVNTSVPNAMVLATALERRQGKDYQLWLIRGEEKIPAGLLRPDAAGTALAPVPGELVARGADAFAITVEPEGGVAQPTGPIVLVGALSKT